MFRFLAWIVGWEAVEFSETDEKPRKGFRLVGGHMQAFGFGNAECEVVVRHQRVIGRGGSGGIEYRQPFDKFGYEEEEREGSIGMGCTVKKRLF